MSSKTEHDLSQEGNPYRELSLLTEVQLRPEATQRELSQQVGIALGMTNLLLQKLAQKGYVRMTRAGWRRWLYALTPEGLTRKLQLTLVYINRFIGQYQQVRQLLRDELALEQLHSESRVAIYGTGEIAEMVYLALKDLGIEEISVFARGRTKEAKFLGMPVKDLSTYQPDQCDRIILAVPDKAKGDYSKLIEFGVAEEKLVLVFPTPHMDAINSGKIDDAETKMKPVA